VKKGRERSPERSKWDLCQTVEGPPGGEKGEGGGGRLSDICDFHCKRLTSVAERRGKQDPAATGTVLRSLIKALSSKGMKKAEIEGGGAAQIHASKGGNGGKNEHHVG